MKRLTKSSLLVAAGLALSNIAAFGQAGNNDVVLGFNSATSANDYIVNLGQLLSASSEQNLSASISAFNTVFSSASGVNVGAIGGQPGSGFSQAGADVLITMLRTGGNPVGSVGTETVFSTPSPASTISAVATIGQGLNFGSVDKTIPQSWTFNVAQNPTTAGTKGNTSFVTLLGGDNPMSQMGSSTIALDLFESVRTGSTTANPFGYVGTLNFDFSNLGSPTLTFDPAGVAVPEPSTYGLVAGAGLLALSLRRRFAKRA